MKIYSTKQNADTASAVVLILLLLAFFRNDIFFVKIAIPVLVLKMIWSDAFYPVSIIYYQLSEWLGRIMSFLILSIIYIVIVFPVGIVRRIAGKDSLKLRLFKNDTESVFVVRNHEYTDEDLKNPY